MHKLEKCPKCGFVLELPKGGKKTIRIWASTQLAKEWDDYSKNHKTKEIALLTLLTKAKLYDKLQTERSRIAVEAPTKP